MGSYRGVASLVISQLHFWLEVTMPYLSLHWNYSHSFSQDNVNATFASNISSRNTRFAISMFELLVPKEVFRKWWPIHTYICIYVCMFEKIATARFGAPFEGANRAIATNWWMKRWMWEWRTPWPSELRYLVVLYSCTYTRKVPLPQLISIGFYINCLGHNSAKWKRQPMKPVSLE
jgi:hypothetical protein